MPSYTYCCDKCSHKFELFFYIKDYQDKPQCLLCGSGDTYRSYHDDIGSIFGSVKKSDSELKTIGDLANRNRDRYSDDHKEQLKTKHNEYKDQKELKELPKGMQRLKKENGTKWT